MFTSQFGARLRFLRKLAELTQAELAERLDVTVEHISNMERGKASPSFKTLAALSQALQTEPANLFFFTSPFSGAGESASLHSLPQAAAVSRLSTWTRDVSSGGDHWDDSLFFLLGYAPGQVEPDAARFFLHVHPEDRELVEDRCLRVLAGFPEDELRFRLTSTDNQTRHVSVHSCTLNGSDGSPMLVFNLLADVSEQYRLVRAFKAMQNALERAVDRKTATLKKANKCLKQEIQARKRAEQAALESELRYHTLFDEASDAIYVFAEDGTFLNANRKAHASLGYTREEFLQLNLTDTVPPQNVEWAKSMVRTVLSDGRNRRFTTARRRKDGSELLVEVNSTPVQYQGQPAILAIARELDIPPAATLAPPKAAPTGKIGYLAGISHEIRSSLSGLLGFLRLMDTSSLGPKQRFHLQLARDSGQALAEIVNDVLDVAKMEAGQLALADRPLDLRALATSVTGLFRPQVEAQGLSLKLEVDPALPEHIRGDPLRLRQVLTNLIDNAAKHTATGGITVGVRVVDTQVRPELMLTVQDTGSGIAPELQSSIFEEFVQAGPEREGSTGLGLAIVKRLVGLMDGEVSLRSVPNQGTTFSVRLPLRPTHEEHTAPQPQAPQAALRILLAEDMELVRLPIRHFLQQAGHTVLEAATGAQALAMLEHQPCELVLMDVQMPVLDGLQATRQIRAGMVPGLDPHVPVIGLTAHALPEEREQFLAAGMSASLPKPLDYVRLGQLITTLTTQRPRLPGSG